MATNISHWLGGSKITYLWKSVFWSAFIIRSLFISVPYFTLLMLDLFQNNQGVKQFGSRSGTMFCRPDLCPNYQQMTKVATSWQRFNSRTISWYYFLAKTLALSQFSLAPSFSIWLKSWLHQILSQGKPCYSSATLYLGDMLSTRDSCIGQLITVVT